MGSASGSATRRHLRAAPERAHAWACCASIRPAPFSDSDVLHGTARSCAPRAARSVLVSQAARVGALEERTAQSHADAAQTADAR